MASWWRAYSIAFSILYRIEWVETYPGGRDPEGIQTSFSILYRIEWVETYTENAALWSRLDLSVSCIGSNGLKLHQYQDVLDALPDFQYPVSDRMG